MRLRQELRIPILLDRSNGLPLQRQLAAQLRRAIEEGVLNADARLPSTRTMAETLEVSRSVTAAAYDELVAQNYLESRGGSGTYVTAWHTPEDERGPAVAAGDHCGRSDRHTIDLTPGPPGMTHFPVAVWRSAWRRTCHQIPALERAPAAGLPELREAIAGHLRTHRGIAAESRNVLVTSDAREGLDLLARALFLPGQRVVVEDPGCPAVRRVLADRGLEVVPAPVDEYGLIPELLPDDVDAVVVSPSHQMPLGGRMSHERRVRLCEWVALRGAVIIEDDRHAEFDGGVIPTAPLSCLAEELEPDVTVVHVNCFAHMISPALRVGYLFGPAEVVEAVGRVADDVGQHPSVVLQQVTTDLIVDGQMTRYLARATADCSRKRRLMREWLVPVMNVVSRLSDLHIGLHVCVELRRDVCAARVADRLARRGVVVPTLAGYGGESTRSRNGLVIGYAHLETVELRNALDVLTDELGRAAADPGCPSGVRPPCPSSSDERGRPGRLDGPPRRPRRAAAV
ncbi:PLP-dependent aminotransferase family protein [Streptomyces sp. ODS05-4]|uniref:MocR-like pyridoxine biosynthesis transcription factor PdxR n=1 Tax=Streptomyces sp. ODS05-4 TaxID=2944939 RepID=UPI00210DF466|nr:PLP-dependent aminotransferase family protein [Streptomyces sp. ODS05-4]